jgi:hypothetical protein
MADNESLKRKRKFKLIYTQNTYIKLLRTCLASSETLELAKPTNAKYLYF